MKYFTTIHKITIVALALLLANQSFGQLNKAYFYNQGRNFLSQEQYPEAIAALNQLLRADSTIDEAWFLRGVAKYYLNDLQGARSDFNKAISHNPVFSQAYLYRAIVLSRLSRFSQSISDYDMAIDLRPSFSLAYFNRGIAYMLSNEPQKAIIDFSQTIKFEPRNLDAWINRGTARAMNTDSLGALSDYNQAVILNPFYSNSYSRRGKLYFEMGDNFLALADFNTAIELDSTISLNYFYRALINNTLKKPLEAITDLNRTIALNPDNALSIYNRGLIQWHIGKPMEALSDFNEVVKLNPENILIYYNRAVLQYELKYYADAINDFSNAINLFPDFANAYLGRSAAHAMLDNKKDSYNDQTFAQSIAEKFKDKHTQPWTDTTERFDDLIAFSSDFSPKTSLPLAESYNSQSIDIKPFVRLTAIHKNELPTAIQGIDMLDRLNSQIEQLDIRFVLSSKAQVERNLLDTVNSKDPFIHSIIHGIKSDSDGKYSEAINAYKKALSIEPNNPLAMLNLAIAEAEMINFIASFQKDIVSVSIEQSALTQNKSNRNNPFTEISYDESLETLSKLESVYHKHHIVEYNKGNIFAYSGEMEKAIACYSKACKAEPELAEAWYNRGLIYLMLKETEKGCSDLGIAGEKGIKQAYLLIHKFCRK